MTDMSPEQYELYDAVSEVVKAAGLEHDQTKQVLEGLISDLPNPEDYSDE